MMIPVAVAIFVPVLPHPDQYVCNDHCIRRRYHVYAITNEPHDVAAMYADGSIQKVVVARPEHLAALIADAEVVTQWVQARLPRQRRTGRRARQGGAGR